MDITLIVIIGLAVAALIALGIHLNERRKKQIKARHLASKKNHPAGTTIPAGTIKAKDIVSTSITSQKLTPAAKVSKPAQTEYVAPTFRKTETESTNFPSTPKSSSYKSRYNDDYYPSNVVVDSSNASMLAALAIANSSSVQETEKIMNDYVSSQESSYSPPAYEAPSSSSYDSNGSSGSYTSSYDSSGSSGSYSSSSDSSSSFSFD